MARESDSVPKKPPKEKTTVYLDVDDLDWIEEQTGTVFEDKSELIRYAVKAMRKRGALGTLKYLQEGEEEKPDQP